MYKEPTAAYISSPYFRHVFSLTFAKEKKEPRFISFL